MLPNRAARHKCLDSPQVRQWLISGKKHCIRVALLVAEQLKSQDLRKLGNIRKMQNLDEDRAK